MGPSAALAGVFVRTGSLLPSGERIVCGLAQQFDSLCFVEDNGGCFDGRPLPANGGVILFGAHQIFVGTELPALFPSGCMLLLIPLPSVLSAVSVSLAPLAAWRSW